MQVSTAMLFVATVLCTQSWYGLCYMFSPADFITLQTACMLHMPDHTFAARVRLLCTASACAAAVVEFSFATADAARCCAYHAL
jgi:hypothetical protein